MSFGPVPPGHLNGDNQVEPVQLPVPPGHLNGDNQVEPVQLPVPPNQPPLQIPFKMLPIPPIVDPGDEPDP